MTPAEWWDGYYVDSLAPLMAKWWTKKLGIQCHVMAAEWPQLPDSGFHATKRIAEATSPDAL